MLLKKIIVVALCPASLLLAIPIEGDSLITTIAQEQQNELSQECDTINAQALSKKLDEIIRLLEQLRVKVETLEKQQRDFLALTTDLVIQPQKVPLCQEQQNYDQAVDLMRRKQYTQAVKVFESFIKQYPQSDKIPYAYYWAAEIYITDNNLQKARHLYELLYENYPQHPKVSEALFKMGKIDYNEGLIKNAEKLWTKTIIQYPQSQSAQLAKKSLKILYDEQKESPISENH
jgi:tol-pal system protein YbgF